MTSAFWQFGISIPEGLPVGATCVTLIESSGRFFKYNNVSRNFLDNQYFHSLLSHLYWLLKKSMISWKIISSNDPEIFCHQILTPWGTPGLGNPFPVTLSPVHVGKPAYDVESDGVELVIYSSSDQRLTDRNMSPSSIMWQHKLKMDIKIQLIFLLLLSWSLLLCRSEDSG